MNEAGALGLSPCRTVVTSFNPRQTPTTTSTTTTISNNQDQYFDEGDWVLCVAASPSYIGCAISNGELQIYDPRRLHMALSYRNLHHDGGIITDLVTAPPQQHAPSILVSSGTDGRVCVMDLRQQQQQQASLAFSMPHAPQEEALSVSLGYDGNLAAVGTSKSKIHFYDLRQAQQPLGSYVSAHTDEVTKVRFQQPPHYFGGGGGGIDSSSAGPSASPWLLTASEDGLACVFDTSQPSEEAALKSVMNAQTSLRQVGFFGPNLEGVYCMTGSETMSLWSWESAQCLADFHDIRNRLSVDYLCNAHWDHGRKELSILAGCANGDACLSTLNTTTTTTTTMAQQQQQNQPLQWTTTHRLAGGHRGVVRDWCPLSASLLVTVGEDARMCEWNVTGRQANAIRRGSDGAVRRGSDTAIRRGSDSSFGKSNHHHQHPPAGGAGGRSGPLRSKQRNRRIAAPY